MTHWTNHPANADKIGLAINGVSIYNGSVILKTVPELSVFRNYGIRVDGA